MVHSVPAPQGRFDRTFICKLEGLTDFIDQILIGDRSVYAKQRHTVVHTFERLRDERGFTGGDTIVCEHVALQKRRTRAVFLPLGRPHRDAPFFKIYPGEATEAFCDGHDQGSVIALGIRSLATNRLIWQSNTRQPLAQRNAYAPAVRPPF
jgi:hypothetical protein